MVMAHLGLTPQSSGQLGGHKAQGRTADAAAMVLEDSLAVEEAGAQFLLLEAVPPEVGNVVAKALTIPVYSIGAGPHCDGQLLIVSDAIGQFQAFKPKFVKRYCNVAEMVTNSLREYAAEVRSESSPWTNTAITCSPARRKSSAPRLNSQRCWVTLARLRLQANRKLRLTIRRRLHPVAPAKAGVQIVMHASAIYVYAAWRWSRLIKRLHIDVWFNVRIRRLFDFPGPGYRLSPA